MKNSGPSSLVCEEKMPVDKSVIEKFSEPRFISKHCKRKHASFDTIRNDERVCDWCALADAADYLIAAEFKEDKAAITNALTMLKRELKRYPICQTPS